ncbi:MAG TPA: protease modulator HflC [Devosiaceae bacterium]
MNRLVAFGVVLAIAAYLLFSSVFVVDPRQQAIVTRFGQITRVVEEPGLYFKLPTSMVEQVQFIDKRLLRYDLNNITLQVKDGRFYNVDAFIAYKIDNPRLFRERLSGSLTVAEQRLNTRFESALRQVYGLRGFEEALSKQRNAMMNEAQQLIKAETDQLGINVVDVRILRTDLTDQVLAQTYDRMKAERLAEAAQLRAVGKQQAQTIRAVADRQAIGIVADATRDSEILRGQGDGTRSAIFAEAYDRDPSFFAFYRSLQSYRSSLEGKNTTLVLSPDSEFFKFFGDDGAATAVVPPDAKPVPVPDVKVVPPEAGVDVQLEPNTSMSPVSGSDAAPAPAADGTAAPAAGQ